MAFVADEFDLGRFIEAQDAPDGGGTVYTRALAELTAGRKRSHWMWFIFPQIAGLGASAMARTYAIGSRAEAAAYLSHPLLGARLKACVAAVMGLEGRSAHQVFGSPDDLKFRSSLTLFAQAADQPAVFLAALGKYFGGAGDAATLRLLGRP
jgi:uncharacterized protein (DUF1810 family)